MTREEIARALGCEVPASMVQLAELWEGRPDLLGDLRQALPVYEEVRQSIQDKLGRVPDDLWNRAEEGGLVHWVVYYRESYDDEAKVEEQRLVDALRTMRQQIGSAPRRRRSTESGDEDETVCCGDRVQALFDPSRLLSRREHGCAHTITAYWSGVMGVAADIRAFRQRAFGDPLRTLGDKEADQFIASPLVRLCSFSGLARAGIEADAQGARVERWDMQHESFDNALEVYDHDVARFAPGLNPFTKEAKVYRFTVVMPERRASIQQVVLCRPSSQPRWIPYIPMDTDPYDSDETFPVVLPGSVADVLTRLAAWWSARLPWDEWEIARFIVTGELPTMRPVQVTIRTTGHGEAHAQRGRTGPGKWSESECTATFARKMRMSSPFDRRLRGSVELVVEPWVSEDTVRRCYSGARDVALGRTEQSRGYTHGGRSERVRVPTAEALAMVRAATANALQGRAEDRRSLRAVLRRRLGDYSNALKAYKRALEILDLDPEPLALFQPM